MIASFRPAILPILAVALLWCAVNLITPSDAFGDDPSPGASVVVQANVPTDSDAVVLARLLSSFGPTSVLALMAFFARGWQPTLRIEIVPPREPIPVVIVDDTLPRRPSGRIPDDQS